MNGRFFPPLVPPTQLVHFRAPNVVEEFTQTHQSGPEFSNASRTPSVVGEIIQTHEAVPKYTNPNSTPMAISAIDMPLEARTSRCRQNRRWPEESLRVSMLGLRAHETVATSTWQVCILFLLFKCSSAILYSYQPTRQVNSRLGNWSGQQLPFCIHANQTVQDGSLVAEDAITLWNMISSGTDAVKNITALILEQKLWLPNSRPYGWHVSR